MKLTVVSRTCARTAVNGNPNPRIVDCSREELILRCAMSLIQSANNCQIGIPIEIKFLDDHSDPEFLEKLKLVLSESKHQVELRSLELQGFNNSALEQFREGLLTDDLVYFAEDDYFHAPDAIEAMLSFFFSGVSAAYRQLSAMVIYPYDCPHRYWPGRVDPCRIFYQGQRYWRTITHTANTMMIHSSVVKSFWPMFESLATNYPNVSEDNTINLLYSNLVQHGGPVAAFSPIPSLAYHVSYENEPPNIITDTFTNWKKEWDRLN